MARADVIVKPSRPAWGAFRTDPGIAKGIALEHGPAQAKLLSDVPDGAIPDSPQMLAHH